MLIYVIIRYKYISFDKQYLQNGGTIQLLKRHFSEVPSRLAAYIK